MNYDYSSYEKHQDAFNYFQTTDGKMAFLDQGEGKPLLLLHGVPNSSWLYRKMINPLVAKGYRVIVPDMLGYGSSDKPSNDKVYHTAKQGDRIIALMKSLGIRSWSHVCHDAGGLWTWEILLKEPARIHELIIFNTIGYQEGFNPPFRRPQGTLFVRLFTKLYSTWGFTHMVMNGFWSANLRCVDLSSSEKKGYIQPLLNRGDHALRYFFGDFYYAEKLMNRVHEVFRLWDKPVMIAWGAHDKTLDCSIQIPLFQTDFHKIKPEVHILEEGSHLIQEEFPEKLAKLIHGFLSKS